MAGFFFPEAPLSPEEEKERRMAAIRNALANPARNVGEGFGQLAAGIATAYKSQGKQFPQAPGGGKPNFGTALGNLFTWRHNGGLY